MQQINHMSLRQMVNFYQKMHRKGVLEKGSAGYDRYIQLQNQYNKIMREKNGY